MFAGTLNYVRTGRAGAPLVVLVHAVGTDLTYWDHQIGALRHDHDVVAYDLAGHGASAPPGAPPSFAASAADLALVIETAGAGPAHVIGLSVGGMIAQTLALARPDLIRSLCLLDTASTFSDGVRDALRQRGATTRDQGMEAIVQPTLDRWFTPAFAERRPDVIDRVAKTLRSNDPGMHAAMWDMIATLDTAPHLPAVDKPTLVLVGEKDPTTPLAASQLIAERVPGAVLHVLPDVSHISPVEAPELVNRTVGSFLAAH